MSSYVFFDVETPNRLHDRICSIGVVRTNCSGDVEYRKHFYVNPEQGFDDDNVRIHGITYSKVKDAPSFAELWESELASIMDGAQLVAHNASFDMAVLGKALSSYGLSSPEPRVICTRDIARERILLPDYHLPTLCSHYGIEIGRHHDAMDDALACMGAYWAMVDEFGSGLLLGRPYVWAPYEQRLRNAACCDKAMTDLYGIALGIAADARILPEEAQGFRDWMARNEADRDAAFLRDAFDLLEKVLEDGRVTEAERRQVVSLARPFAQNGHGKQETVAMQELLGILRGISCDGRINEHEAMALSEWLEQLDVGNVPGITSVKQLLGKVLEDRVISAEEEAEMLSLFERIINPVAAGTPSSCGCDGGGVVFDGKKFVLTGTFSHGERREVENYIKARGGAVVGSVSGKVAYVVVGEEGSGAYAYGSYGTKVEKAMALQDAGKPIQIIREQELFR